VIEIDTGTQELLCQVIDRVAIITLNKPHKKNALGDILTPALREILLIVEADERVGCVMLTGAGDAFCSGGDVSGMGGSTAEPRSREERVDDLTKRQQTLTQRLYELDKITIAALPGAAAGAGASIALACDLRIGSENAFITTAFRNIGLSGDYGSSWFLPRLIGLAKAKELMYRAERIDAAECLQLGLLNRVFPVTTFREDALAYARSLAEGPTQTLGRMKQNLHAGMNQDLAASLRLEAANLVDSAGGSEAREAISAFLEKRTPVFHPAGHDPDA
jgi:enoyl-CoA hydratase/carnithine racemase